jgi:hypothetical protein
LGFQIVSSKLGKYAAAQASHMENRAADIRLEVADI